MLSLSPCCGSADRRPRQTCLEARSLEQIALCSCGGHALDWTRGVCAFAWQRESGHCVWPNVAILLVDTHGILLAGFVRYLPRVKDPCSDKAQAGRLGKRVFGREPWCYGLRLGLPGILAHVRCHLVHPGYSSDRIHWTLDCTFGVALVNSCPGPKF